MNPGIVVRFRNREWVVLPSGHDEIIALRPLTGLEEEVVEVHRRLSQLLGYELPFE
ncbi:MAG: hypothetical protein RMJ47_03430 [Bacteroidota bacterium]|nr:hypothetical protein [Bacteroidota bacterium]